MRDIAYLRGAEALVRNCHELMTDALGQAADGADAVLQNRLDALAKLIMAELKTIRATIKLTLKEHKRKAGGGR